MSKWLINSNNQTNPQRQTQWGQPTTTNTASNDNRWKKPTTSYKTVKRTIRSLYLLSDENNMKGVNFFKLMPKYFEITTSNSSGKFNIDLLSADSNVISRIHRQDSSIMQYHLDISDELNVLNKFEKLYQGETIVFLEEELPIARKIKDDLNLISLKKKITTDQQHPNLLFNPKIKPTISVNINQELKQYIQSRINEKFTIRTQKNEYKCNIFGIFSSLTIREFLSKNPKADFYIYDFDDSKNEFKFVCNLFNFQFVSLSNDNVFVLNEIFQDLKIDLFSKEIDNFIQNIEKISRSIDDQQSKADKIDELSELLFSIKEKKVDFVLQNIVNLNWTKTTENIQELAAFIIQAIKADFRLHPYLFELLVKLDEFDDDELKILIPIVVKNLMNDFLDLKSLNTVPFIYKMYEKGFITKGKIVNKLKENIVRNFFVASWFYPELKEVDCSNTLIRNRENRLLLPANLLNIDIEEFKQIRKKEYYDDEISNALRNDDIDTFQSIVAQRDEKFLQNSIKKNMFEPIFSKNVRFLNYAAAYGSIKCFKYLLLNDEKIDDLTFEMAVIGGNIELIRIVDNEKPKEAFSSHVMNEIIHNSLKQSIMRHQDDIFDWILEQKFSEFDQKSYYDSLITCSIENNNAHSLIQLIDNGFDIHNNTGRYSSFLEISASSGFYLFSSLLLNIMNKNSNNRITIKPIATISFGNISILKLFSNIMSQGNLEDALIYAIQNGLDKIIQYFFDSIINKRIKINPQNSKKILHASINSLSSESFADIIDKINACYPIYLASLYDLLNESIDAKNIKCAKKVAEVIYSNNLNNDFTDPLCKVVKLNLNELIEFFLVKKSRVDYKKLAEYTFKFLSKETFLLIMKNIDSENQKILINCLDLAINYSNKPLINEILKDNPPLNTSLIEAVKTHVYDIVEMILEKNSSPSFINQRSRTGTALIISILNDDYFITKKLLSIPGINPSLYNEYYETPLIIAARKLWPELFIELINFYGDKIKDQKWQIEKAAKAIVERRVLDKSDNPKFKTILTTIIGLNCIDLNHRFVESTILFCAIKYNFIDVVKDLVQDPSIDLNIYDPIKGETPLILSVRLKYKEISEILINHPKTDINLSDYEGNSALIIAVKSYQVDIIDLLLESKKFNPDENNINLAFFMSDMSVAQKLLSLKSLDVNFVPLDFNKYNSFKDANINGHEIAKSPIIKSIIANNNELFELIIQHPSFDTSKLQFYGALYASMSEKRSNFFIKLLEKSDKIDINSHIFSKISLLVSSIQKNTNTDIVSAILNYPTFNSKESDIVNAFDLALIYSSFQTLICIYEFDCQHDHLIDPEIAKNGSNLLISIIKKKNPLPACIKFLLDHGADPNKHNENNEYPFVLAVLSKAEELIFNLINSNKLDFNMKIKTSDSKEKTTYLHVLAGSNQTKLLKYVLDKHLCDINIKNDLGETPLFEACRKGQIDNVKLFFTYDDLDFLHRNNDDMNVIDVITNSENSEEIESKEKFLSKLIESLKANQFKNDANTDSIKALFFK